jgi:hypothetical protein
MNTQLSGGKRVKDTRPSKGIAWRGWGMFDYVAYRVFEYFSKKDESFAVSRTINFLALFQGTLIVPLFMVVNLFTQIDPQIFGVNNRIKYYIGIPLAIILGVMNSYNFKKKLKGEGLMALQKKYRKENLSFSVWWIFLAPIFFVFIFPLIYGTLNGTIHFPFLER